MTTTGIFLLMDEHWHHITVVIDGSSPRWYIDGKGKATMTSKKESINRESLREALGAVIDRWYRLGMIRFSSRDDGSDDLLLRDELTAAMSIASNAELGRLREALAYIQEICKPLSMSMQGPVWFDGGTPAGGGSRERIWRICHEALEEQP